MVIDELLNFHRIYGDFVYEWGLFKDSVLKSIKTNEVPNYKLLEDRDADREVRFFFCGVPCYVRFKYDLKRGDAEYGVLVPGATEDHPQHRAIQQVDLVEFDQGSRRLYEGRAMIMHERKLASLFPQMLAAFFGDSSKNP